MKDPLVTWSLLFCYYAVAGEVGEGETAPLTQAEFGDMGRFRWSPANKEVSVTLDWDQIITNSNGLLDESCLNVNGDKPGLRYHIHTTWLNLDDRHFAFGSDCGGDNTGGHYDPDKKCGPSSDADCSGTDPDDYDCSVDNPEGCEIGDLSGRVGRFNPDDATKVSGNLKMMAWTDDYLTIDTNFTKGYSIVFHCGDPSVATNGVDRAFCAPLEDATEYWDYYDPQEWGDIAGFEICNEGQRQSPIELDDDIVVRHGHDNLTTIIDYKDNVENLTFVNNWHEIRIEHDFGEIDFQHGHYATENIHFHCPAEHTIGGERYACEMHIVHRHPGKDGLPYTDDDDFVVLAIFMDEQDDENEILAKWGWDDILAFDTGLKSVDVSGQLSVDELIAPALGSDFFRYDGSLTTPPCAQHVRWFLLTEPIPIGKSQVSKFNAIFPDPANSRPVQEMHTRRLYWNQILIPDDEGPRLMFVGIIIGCVAVLATAIYCCWKHGRKSENYEEINSDLYGTNLSKGQK